MLTEGALARYCVVRELIDIGRDVSIRLRVHYYYLDKYICMT